MTGSGEIYVDSDGNRARTTTLKWVDQKPSKTTVDTLALYDDNVEYVTVEDGSGAANCTKIAVENGFAYVRHPSTGAAVCLINGFGWEKGGGGLRQGGRGAVFI